jgi:hypothetical protein
MAIEPYAPLEKCSHSAQHEQLFALTLSGERYQEYKSTRLKLICGRCRGCPPVIGCQQMSHSTRRAARTQNLANIRYTAASLPPVRRCIEEVEAPAATTAALSRRLFVALRLLAESEKGLPERRIVFDLEYQAVLGTVNDAYMLRRERRIPNEIMDRLQEMGGGREYTQ